MFQAQFLMNTATTSIIVYGPWMPRQGDNITFTLDLVGAKLTGNFVVELVTKNSEDTGAGTLSGVTAVKSTAGQIDATARGVEELVRYRYTFSEAAAGDWALFRMLDPIWWDDVAP
ncbi:MAG: hypothetical protein R3F20_05475 [Planctomycetota bacterium]